MPGRPPVSSFSTLASQLVAVAVIMDVATEPILAVIGHPIAGNPSQFAVERALRSLQLDWRVLSFDVQPSDVRAALEGLEVLGIIGILIDGTLGDEAASWQATPTLEDDDSESLGPPSQEAAESVSTQDEDSGGSASAAIAAPAIDCLYRDDHDRLVGSHQRYDWLTLQITNHEPSARGWIGGTLAGHPIDATTLEAPLTSPPEAEEIAALGVIVLAGSSDEFPLEVDDWPTNDGSTIVIDLTGGHADLPLLERLGYRVIGEVEQHIGMLQGCLKKWTGKDTPQEVLLEAIEEYLGV